MKNPTTIPAVKKPKTLEATIDTNVEVVTKPKRVAKPKVEIAGDIKPKAASKAKPLSSLERVEVRKFIDAKCSPQELAETIVKLLDDKKGVNIISIDLGGKTIIADYFVIASAKSTTAAKALAEYVEEKLSKDSVIEPLRIEGMKEGRWVALDYGSVIVHVFHEETREMYQLEKLWS